MGELGHIAPFARQMNLFGILVKIRVLSSKLQNISEVIYCCCCLSKQFIL